MVRHGFPVKGLEFNWDVSADYAGLHERYERILADGGLKLSDDAFSRAKDAFKTDKARKKFSFNSGLERRTFPAYNPYTISKCATCPKAELKLATGLPGNENCAACQLIKLMIGEKEKINHLAEYERLKADKNYKDVAFDEESGGVKATHISHKTKTSKME